MAVDLVSARYKEEMQLWFPETSIKVIDHWTIYNKSEPVNVPSVLNLPNLGREAHSYLTHMLSSQMSTEIGYTVFSQGDPFPHCPEFLHRLPLIPSRTEAFITIGHTCTCDGRGMPQHALPVAECHRQICGTNRSHFKFVVGAQFAVQNALIWKARNNGRLDRAMEMVNKDRGATVGGTNEGLSWGAHLLERLWSYIFTDDDAPDTVWPFGFVDIHAVNPYVGFTPEPANDKLDLDGWGGEHKIFNQLVLETKPTLAIEVGSWKGQSAISTAGAMQKHNIFGYLVCVDTWLGSLEMWGDHANVQYYKSLNLKNGYPTVYRRFLSNIMNAGLDKFVIPFPVTSEIAAKWFKAKAVKADLIYVDASHDYDSVLRDINAFVPLLAPNGIIFGDDYDHWPGVRDAVQSFLSLSDFRAGFNLDVVDGRYWILRRK